MVRGIPTDGTNPIDIPNINKKMNKKQTGKTIRVYPSKMINLFIGP